MSQISIQLVENVRDVDDADAAGFERANCLEQALDLAMRKPGGRLVHQQDLGVQRQRLGDFDLLALDGGQVGHLRIEIEVDPVGFEQRLRVGALTATVEQAPAARRLAPEIEIVEHAHRRGKVRMLVDAGDAQFQHLHRVARLDGPAADLDLAGIGPHGTGQYLDQRRFPGTVGADQRTHLPCPERDRGIRKRDKRTICLGQPAGAK